MVSESPVKRHLIKSAPPKKSILGGDLFLGYLHQFLVLEQQKHFGESMEQAGIFDRQFGRFWTIYGHLKFKKSGIFSIFGQIWQLFFSFQNAILGKIGLLKMGFMRLFRS
jgi:hypothetical protein